MMLSKVDHDGDPGTPDVPVRIGGDYPTPWLIRVFKLAGVYRFLLGRPMDNVVRTNSTFWQRGTKGYPSKWLMLPGWKRAAVRLLAVYLLVWLLVVLSAGAVSSMSGTAAPGWTRTLTWWHVLLGHVVPVSLVAVPVLVRRRVRDKGLKINVPVLQVERKACPVRVVGWTQYEILGQEEWDREYVLPVALAAARVLSLDKRPEHAGRWVTVPRDFMEPDGGPVAVLLPSDFTGADRGTQDRLVRAVSARLNINDPVSSFRLSGGAPRLEVRVPPVPPERVGMGQVRHLLERAEEYRPFMGLTGKRTGVYAEMVEDSPHIAVSSGPGGGKSTLAKLVAVQALRWGWGVVILDWKMSSAFDWAKGLRGVTYLTELEAIHDFGARLTDEVDIRKSNGMSGRARVLVIRDEWNVTAELLMSYWTDLRQTADREERRSMPTKSPALRGFATLDFAGREYGLHDFVIGQRLSARAFNGNADIRECFQIRCLARYSDQTKKMLVGNMRLPRKSNVPGRWVIVAGEEVSVVQVPMISTEEAREFASGGLVNPTSPLTSTHYPELAQPGDMGTTLGNPLGHGPTLLPPPMIEDGLDTASVVDARKLADIVPDVQHLGVTLEILRHAVKRDDAFPAPEGGSSSGGYLYDRDQVIQWARARHARMQAERGEK